MDSYLECSVAGERGPREHLSYAIHWAAVVVLGLASMFFATGVLMPSEGGGINWPGVALMVICAALAVLIYLRKDNVYREYDYLLWNGELEIYVVYNRRRRKKMGTIPLDKVSAWGPAAAMEGRCARLRKHAWCVHPDRAWGLIYPASNGSEAALLELSDEMAAQIRAAGRELRDAEVKP